MISRIHNIDIAGDLGEASAHIDIPTKYDPCPACGLNRVIVGRAHNCRPRATAPVEAGCGANVITPWAQNLKVTINKKVDNKSVDNKSNICQPKAIVVNQVDKYTSDRVFDGKRPLSPERVEKIKESLHIPPKRGRGRPKIAGPRPWETEGISRQAWYKRQSKIKLGLKEQRSVKV